MWLRFGLPYMLLITIVDVLFKVVARWDIHPMFFTCQAMIFGGFTLLVISKPGPLALETIRSIGTWVYGIVFLIANVIFITSLIYLDIVTVNFITASSIIVTYLFSFLFLGRNRFNWLRSLMLLLIGICVAVIIIDLPIQLQGIASLVAIAFAFTHTIRVLSQETHAASNKTKGSITNECRVTGFTIGITALIFALALIAISLVTNHTNIGVLERFVPSFEQMLSLESLLFAAVYGVFMLSVLRYMEFAWIKKIKSERYVILMTILPAVTFIFEIMADRLGIVSFAGLTPLQTGAGILTLVAAGLIEYSESKDAKKDAAQNLTKSERTQIAEDLHVIQHTLETCGQDKAQAASLLGIGKDLLNYALKAEENGAPLSKKISDKIKLNFTKNVAVVDSLTGLANKTQFVSLLRESLMQGEEGILLFMDLNKFKPVNDTYGHEAGDEVLKIFAQRLQACTDKQTIISRLGGDEFAMLLISMKEAGVPALKKRIIAKISEPMQLDSVSEKVVVGTSIGYAVYPKDSSDALALLHHADQSMYEGKKDTGR